MKINHLELNGVLHYAVFITPYDTRLDAIRAVNGRRWLPDQKRWILPITVDTTNLLSELVKMPVPEKFRGRITVQTKPKPKNPSLELAPLSTEREAKVEQFKHYLQSKRFSESTIKTYSDALRIFLRYFADKPIEGIDNQDVIQFNVNYILANGYSSTYQNQVVNSIKKFFLKVEHRSLDLEAIERPRSAYKLPNVLSKEEVKLILQAHKNEKHKMMLTLIYACGLRRSELINLKITDVLSDRNLLLIKQSKGKKDRIVPLSDTLLDMLRSYYKIHRPVVWLFEGQQEGRKYSERSLELVLKKSIKLVGINKPVTLHWLRHSYATHLLESGTDLRYIQELLGHKSSRTTEIYTHVSTKSIQQIRSPFDDL